MDAELRLTIDEYVRTTKSIDLEYLEKLVSKEFKRQANEAKKARRTVRRARAKVKKPYKPPPARVTRLALKETITGERSLDRNTVDHMRDVMGIMRCTSCQTVKTVSEFKNKHTCKECVVKARGEDTLESYSSYIVGIARNRSGHLGDGFGFNVTPEWVAHRFNQANGECEICGGKMTHSRPSRMADRNEQNNAFITTPTNISMDQIKNGEGYTTDNVQLTHVRCNVMKMDMTMEDFVETCKLIALKHD